jgi:hypothetical protein
VTGASSIADALGLTYSSPSPSWASSCSARRLPASRVQVIFWPTWGQRRGQPGDRFAVEEVDKPRPDLRAANARGGRLGCYAHAEVHEGRSVLWPPCGPAPRASHVHERRSSKPSTVRRHRSVKAGPSGRTASSRWCKRQPPLVSSPGTPAVPQAGFACASRAPGAGSPGCSQGRPGRLGQVRERATGRRCQASSVPGVTSRWHRYAAVSSRAARTGAQPDQSASAGVTVRLSA